MPVLTTTTRILTNTTTTTTITQDTTTVQIRTNSSSSSSKCSLHSSTASSSPVTVTKSGLLESFPGKRRSTLNSSVIRRTPRPRPPIIREWTLWSISMDSLYRSSCNNNKILLQQLLQVNGVYSCTHHTATEHHLPYGITNCYLPTDTGECTPP